MKHRKLMLGCALALALIGLGSSTLLRAHVAKEMLQVTHLKFTPPGGKEIKACVLEGGMVKITNHRTGTVYAYQPTVLDASSGAVSLRVYRVTGSGADETLEEVETLGLSFKGGKATVKSPAYHIEVETIGKTAAGDGTGTTANTPSPDGEVGGGPQCCVTCGEITTCSNCTVTMSCGSCCTGKAGVPACQCGPET